MRALFINVPFVKIDAAGQIHTGPNAGSRWPFTNAGYSGYGCFPFFLAYAVSYLRRHGIDADAYDAVASRHWDLSLVRSEIARRRPDVVFFETSTPLFRAVADTARWTKEHLGSRIVFVGPARSGVRARHPRAAVRRSRDRRRVRAVSPRHHRARRGRQAPVRVRAPRGHRHAEGRQFSPAPSARPALGVLRSVDGHGALAADHIHVARLPLQVHLLPVAQGDEQRQLPIPTPRVGAGRDSHRAARPRGLRARLARIARGSGATALRAAQRARRPGDYALARGDHAEAAAEIAEAQSIERALNTITTGGVRSLFFDDDTWNLGKRRVRELCAGLADIGLPWTMMGRIDTTGRDLFDLMVDSGCVGMRFGIESFSQRLLDNTKKNLDARRSYEMVRELITRYSGLEFHFTTMRNLPGETQQDFERDQQILADLRAAGARNDNRIHWQNSSCIPFPGTELWEEMVALGKGTKLRDFDMYDGGPSATEELASLVGWLGEDYAAKWSKYSQLGAPTNLPDREGR